MTPADVNGTTQEATAAGTRQTAESASQDLVPPYGAVLFLDFDGVTHAEGAIGERLFRRLPAIEAVLVNHPRVMVVISSTWRLMHSLAALRARFSEAVAERVVGVTPHFDDGEPFQRERECVAWLRTYAKPWTPWVAIDDRVWLFRPFCAHLIAARWRGHGIEQAQLLELDARLSEFR
ncbi:MAG: hypothetical protein JO369_05375 [Paucibacter sp.]|nr:hypothetical protein [Roseateles sp.]